MGLVSTAVIMAFRANRVGIESALQVTGCALQLGMGFIKLQPCDGMFEVPLIPSRMAVRTTPVQLCDPLAGRMTGAAIKAVMIWIKRPTGLLV